MNRICFWSAGKFVCFALDRFGIQMEFGVRVIILIRHLFPRNTGQDTQVLAEIAPVLDQFALQTTNIQITQLLVLRNGSASSRTAPTR